MVIRGIATPSPNPTVTEKRDASQKPSSTMVPAGPFRDACEEEVERQLTHEERCLLVSERYGLSERETEVLELVGKGRDLPYIRDHLFISRNTVNTHIKHIYAKTGVHSKQELLTLLERQ